MPTDPTLGEIFISAFDFAPKGYALCNGQLLSISQNTALFSLLGTNYGGNGITNFALPNLSGRVPIHFGNGHNLGESSGEAAHTLQIGEIPPHNHTLSAVKNVATSADPSNNKLATATGMMGNAYGAAAALTPLSPASIGGSGGGQSHTNVMPSLGLNFYIAVFGIFPSRD